MLKEYLKTKEFYDLADKVCKRLIYKYFKNHPDKESLIDFCYMSILNKISDIKDFDLYSQDYKLNYDILEKIAKKAMLNEMRKEKTTSNKTFSNLQNQTKENSPILDNISNYDIYEVINFNDLINLLKAFLLTQNKDTQKIIILMLKGYTTKEIGEAFGVYYNKISFQINEFRENFSKYLIQHNFYYTDQAQTKTKQDIARENRKAYRLRKSGKSGYEIYKNDYKINKLLRDDDNLKKYSDCLQIEESKLKDIITHKNGKLRLFLYQIQKLRVTFFPQYSFNELIEC